MAEAKPAGIGRRRDVAATVARHAVARSWRLRCRVSEDAMEMGEELNSAAHRICDEVFLPDAAAVERMGRIPDAHFDALVAAGLYGAFAPTEMGGAGLG